MLHDSFRAAPGLLKVDRELEGVRPVAGRADPTAARRLRLPPPGPCPTQAAQGRGKGEPSSKSKQRRVRRGCSSYLPLRIIPAYILPLLPSLSLDSVIQSLRWEVVAREAGRTFGSRQTRVAAL